MSVSEEVGKVNMIRNIGLGLWCLTPLSTIFQLFRGGSKHRVFISCGKASNEVYQDSRLHPSISCENISKEG